MAIDRHLIYRKILFSPKHCLSEWRAHLRLRLHASIISPSWVQATRGLGCYTLLLVPMIPLKTHALVFISYQILELGGVAPISKERTKVRLGMTGRQGQDSACRQ